MTILVLFIILAFLAVLAWLVNFKFAAKLTPGMRFLFNLVLAIIAVLTCLQAFGVWDAVRGARVPHI